MPPKSKKAAKSETAKAKTTSAPTVNEYGVPLGRPAFATGSVANDVDAQRPAGAVQLAQINAAPGKPGSSTLTLMNPTPPPATASPKHPKRG